MLTNSTAARTVPSEVLSALTAGRISDAIRLVRASEHCGFRDAKRIVEHYILQDPVLLCEWQRRHTASLAILRRVIRALAMVSGAALGWLIVR